MSSEFIQFTFPCTECIVRAACDYKPRKIKEVADMADGGADTRCIIMPKIEGDNSYLKTFMECWANLGWDAVSRIKSDEGTGHIPPQYIDFLIDTLGLIQWMTNSKSWEDGKAYDFDLSEVRQKLKKAKGWL